jgi:hypothetical protein
MDDGALFLLEQQSPFFANYVKQFPDLALQVRSDVELALLISAQLDGYTHLTVGELVVVRDAAYRLVGFADQGGFCSVSSYFYWVYEVASKQALSFVEG